MYRSSELILAGGNFVSGDILHSHGSRPGFKQLQEHVAANALHNSGEVSDQPKCHPGTRVAILDHLIAWAATLTYTYPIVWVHGPAGSGKSSILRMIAQMLFDQKILLASFFFFRTAPGRNSSDRFIATISYQLALSIPATRPHIEDALEENPLIFSLSLWDQAQALIISPILAIRDQPTFDASQFPRIIVVDGLDECNDSKKQCEILDVLCRVLQNLPIPFAVLVASRPEHHIRAAFDLGVLNRSSSRLSLNNSYNPDADIKKFLSDRFNNIQRLHPFRSYLPTSWPSQAVIHKLVANASGQFIYASTVDKFVSSVRHNPAERLDILLGILDRGTLMPFEQLDAMYSTIFSTIDPVNLVGTLRVLGAFLVSYSKRPPSPRFLDFLLGLGMGGVRRLLFDLECLITISSNDEDIHFFHASLSDYLFDKSRSGQYWIDTEIVYADLAQQCLSQLPKSGPIDFNTFFIDNIPILFSKAAPTAGLHEAIKNHDLESAREFYRNDPSLLIFLQAIRDSKFSDVEELYRDQLAVYARIVEPKIQVYLQDTLAYYAFIAACVVDLPLGLSTNLKHIFRLSPAMLANDENLGFGILSGPTVKDHSRLKTVMKDLLEDPKGIYPIDSNQYADIALYLMKCMTEDSISYVTPGPRPGIENTIENSMANIFPVILSKSSVRHDVIKYIKSTSLSPSYLKDTRISNAMSSYIPFSKSMAVPLGQAASSGITGSRTPRAGTPLQRFLGRFIRKPKDGEAKKSAQADVLKSARMSHASTNFV